MKIPSKSHLSSTKYRLPKSLNLSTSNPSKTKNSNLLTIPTHRKTRKSSSKKRSMN
jgi:hypothetical protein